MTNNATAKIKKILKTIQEELTDKKRKEEEIRTVYTKEKWKTSKRQVKEKNVKMQVK
jgi:hypothetical protein